MQYSESTFTLGSVFSLAHIAKIFNKAKYPTFTRMEPPDSQITKAVLSLLKHYQWNKFSIITEEGDQYSTIAKSLYDQALKRNFTVNHYETFENVHSCCVNKLPCCTTVSLFFYFSRIPQTLQQ